MASTDSLWHVSHESIAKRAHELFEARGRTHGHALDDWFQAERELGAIPSYSVGILIIGSLLWEQRPHREIWRLKRLSGQSIAVRSPIRYGRLSTSRENTYTMVFSNELVPDKLGWALVAPCQRRVANANDLVAEAEALWSAEQPSPAAAGPISDRWGAVGLLCNPRESYDEIQAGWHVRVASEPSYYSKFRHAAGERPALDPAGMLTIPWPTTGPNRPLDFDLLLATATQPKIRDGSYPTVQTIATAWHQNRQQLRYFDENRRAGITTAEDYAIMRLLGDLSLGQ